MNNRWKSQFSVHNKVIVITGSTRGIGRALAEAFAEEGAIVWIHGRDIKTCENIARPIGAHFVGADLTQPESVDHMCSTILAKTPQIHCLINNAAMEVPVGVEEISYEGLRDSFQVNVFAPTMIVRGLLSGLRQASPSSIINMTSIHQTIPYGRNSVYGMTKSALGMYSRTAALELARFGIRVNNLAPGAIETDINKEIIDQIGKKAFADWIPNGRVGTTEEIVGATLYLATQASSYVTGTTLYVDGGYSQNLVRYWA